MSATQSAGEVSAAVSPGCGNTAAAPRVLLLTHRVPYPPDKGDRIRSYNLLRFLSQQASVWLGCVADEPWTADTESVIDGLAKSYCIAPVGASRLVYGGASLACGRSITEGWFYSRRLARWIDAAASQRPFDAVVCFCSGMARYVSLPQLKRTPVIVDLVDVDSEKWLQFARNGSGPKSWLYGIEGRRLRTLERRLGERAAAVTLVSREEAELYRRFAPAATTLAVGNGVDFAYFRRPGGTPRKAHSLVFLGALDYRPNVEGVQWFCRNVWPSIRSRYPEAALKIVGRRPTPAVLALAELPGVKVSADVPDVRPFLFEATAAIAPLQVARGVQNKVLEAMACETPVVASPQALEGISAVAGHDALAAETPEEWSGAIGDIFDNATLAEQLARAGRVHVETHFDWQAQLAPYEELLARCVSADREGR